ncbi:MAG TPA: hypothetical protein VNY52_10765, partial [Solirubrobacteraceae bacterium]|nr:hypothetical protein [Solirubrobacteraceae bacterium]
MPPPPHTTRSRDVALRRLAHCNRWLIAASAALTGVLTAVAASAFPGKTLKTAAGTGLAGSHRATRSQPSSGESSGSSS